MRQAITDIFAVEDRLPGTPRMIIMVGLPRTGKSTFVNKFVRAAAESRKQAFAIVSSDDIRRAMGVRYDSELEAQVKAFTLMFAQALMQRRQNVLIDETNLTSAHRQFWIDLANNMGYVWTIAEIEPLPEPVHYQECRKHQYPWKVIQDMKARYEPVTGDQRARYTLIERGGI